MSAADYADGMADGLADRDPDFERLALGSNHCNDYECGYIDSGKPVAAPSVVASPVLVGPDQ